MGIKKRLASLPSVRGCSVDVEIPKQTDMQRLLPHTDKVSHVQIRQVVNTHCLIALCIRSQFLNIKPRRELTVPSANPCNVRTPTNGSHRIANTIASFSFPEPSPNTLRSSPDAKETLTIRRR